jgi:hypothetical protein
MKIRIKAGQRLEGESQRKYDVENAEECGVGCRTLSEGVVKSK